MENVKLAIVIPALITNREHLRYTVGTIESIRSRHDHRILLVLNRCEGFDADLEALAAAHPLEIIRNPGAKSVAASWNFGITWGLAQGAAAVLVLNNDILLKSDCVDNLLDFAARHPEFILVSGWEHHDPATLEQAEEKEAWGDHPHFSCFLTGKELFRRVGRFDEAFFPAYYEDNDMHHRIRMAGQRAAGYKGALFYHHGSRTIYADPQLATANANTFRRNGDYYVAKWGGLPGRERFGHPATLIPGQPANGGATLFPAWNRPGGRESRPRVAMSGLAARYVRRSKK